jgi:hypothetical protein
MHELRQHQRLQLTMTGRAPEAAATTSSMLGLWMAEFGSSLGLYGTGVVVFTEERLLGGDSGYYYSGHYQLLDYKNFTAQVEINQYNASYESVFGSSLITGTLVIEGVLTNDIVLATGTLASSPAVALGVKLTRKVS